MKPGFCTLPTGAQESWSCVRRKRNGHGEAKGGAQEGADTGRLMASLGSFPSHVSFKDCMIRLGLGPTLVYMDKILVSFPISQK
jgi:hypothetical protein